MKEVIIKPTPPENPAEAINKPRPFGEEAPEPTGIPLGPYNNNGLECEGVTIQDDLLRLNIQLRSNSFNAAQLAELGYNLFSEILTLRKEHELTKRPNGYT